jgi:hypothetical protein
MSYYVDITQEMEHSKVLKNADIISSLFRNVYKTQATAFILHTVRAFNLLRHSIVFFQKQGKKWNRTAPGSDHKRATSSLRSLRSFDDKLFIDSLRSSTKQQKKLFKISKDTPLNCEAKRPGPIF